MGACPGARVILNQLVAIRSNVAHKTIVIVVKSVWLLDFYDWPPVGFQMLFSLFFSAPHRVEYRYTYSTGTVRASTSTGKREDHLRSLPDNLIRDLPYSPGIR